MRYQVRGADMDGIDAYWVVDTKHPFSQMFPKVDYGSIYCFGYSTNQQQVIELAQRMNQEAAQ